MDSALHDIHDYEAKKYINRLLTFLGRREVDKCINRYHNSLDYSGPVFREYYLKVRHPWWNPVTV